MGNEESTIQQDTSWSSIVINSYDVAESAFGDLFSVKEMFLDAQVSKVIGDQTEISAIVVKPNCPGISLSETNTYMFEIFPQNSQVSNERMELQLYCVKQFDKLLSERRVVMLFGSIVVKTLRNHLKISINDAIDCYVLHLGVCAALEQEGMLPAGYTLSFNSLSHMANHYVKDYTAFSKIGFYRQRTQPCSWESHPLGEYEVDKATYDCKLLSLVLHSLRNYSMPEPILRAVVLGSTEYLNIRSPPSPTQCFDRQWFRSVVSRIEMSGKQYNSVTRNHEFHNLPSETPEMHSTSEIEVTSKPEVEHQSLEFNNETNPHICQHSQSAA